MDDELRTTLPSMTRRPPYHRTRSMARYARAPIPPVLEGVGGWVDGSVGRLSSFWSGWVGGWEARRTCEDAVRDGFLHAELVGFIDLGTVAVDLHPVGSESVHGPDVGKRLWRVEKGGWVGGKER